MEPSTFQSVDHKRYVRWIIILVVVLGLVAALVTVLRRGPEFPITKENVVVEKAQDSGLPPDFPPEIPVERADIVSSLRLTYTDRNAILYTFSYRSEESRASKYKEYLDYMTEAGYQFDSNGTNEAQGVLKGTKGSKELMVIVSAQDEKTLVQISYLDRQ